MRRLLIIVVLVVIVVIFANVTGLPNCGYGDRFCYLISSLVPRVVQVDPTYREIIWFGYCINGRLDGICG